MKTPSIKTLTRVFDNPHEARRVLKMKHAELSDHPVGAARILECMHSPKWYDVVFNFLTAVGVIAAAGVAGYLWARFI